MRTPAASAAGMISASFTSAKSGESFRMSGFGTTSAAARSSAVSSCGRVLQAYTSFVFGEEMLNSTRSPNGARARGAHQTPRARFARHADDQRDPVRERGDVAPEAVDPRVLKPIAVDQA